MISQLIDNVLLYVALIRTGFVIGCYAGHDPILINPSILFHHKYHSTVLRKTRLGLFQVYGPGFPKPL